MKVVINTCFGGFSLSRQAWSALKELGHPTALADKDDGTNSFCYNMQRSDPQLVQVVAALGDKADGLHAQLAILDIPDGISWHVEDYDGQEWVAEDHRTWR